MVKNSPLWTGKDWFDNDAKIGVMNGVPYAGNVDVERFIEAPLAIELVGDDYL
jgi:hypothetical protein